MKEEIITEITRRMLPYLDNAQIEQLQSVLNHCLWNVTITMAEEITEPEENYIIKSPMRRIHKIRTTKTVKETYTDEALETMRDQCGNIRDLAIIDLLASTGMRVGEMVKLNIADIDFERKEDIQWQKIPQEL